MPRKTSALVYGATPRVNLMPRAEARRREQQSLIRRWLWTLIAALAIVALAVAATFVVRLFAEQRLAMEEQRSEALITELASLSEVSSALDLERDLLSYRAEAMANDLPWTQTFTQIQSVLPEGVSLIGFDVVTGGVPQGDDPTLQDGLGGTVTLQSPTPIEIAPTARAMRELAGVRAADGQEITSTGTAGGEGQAASYTYVLTITFDQSIYSEAFVAPAEGGE